MLISNEILIVSTAVYLAIMFFIAYRGDNQPSERVSRYQPIIYTLSLTVYCTSWTFYGAVGTAANSGWSFFTIYLGPILVFVFFFPFLKKIIEAAKLHKTTSIADFIATRYGKSNTLSALVTVIAFVGTMPYIALQIKAISNSYDTLVGIEAVHSRSPLTDSAFALAIILAIFSILFGARSIDASVHHRGLIHAISFESIVKLLAFLAIAFLAYDIVDSLAQRTPNLQTKDLLASPFNELEWNTGLLTKTFLAAGAIFLLPRQFHVLAVEARGGEGLSRWGLPLYLLLFSIAVVPITAAGIHLIESKQNADLFVLLIPMFEHNELLSIFGYLGGFSAATGMVIVATLALSTMVSNDLIFPLLVRFFKSTNRREIHVKLLVVRQATIVVLLLLAYGYYYIGGTDKSLQSIGLISFAAAIQFLPAIWGAVYWHKGHRNGVIAGLLFGFFFWIYCLFLPSLANSEWMPFEFIQLLADRDAFFNPVQLFGIEFDDTLTHGVFWSLLFNISAYWFFSIKAQPRLVDRLQASSYIDQNKAAATNHENYQFKVADLFELCIRFTGEERSREYFIEHGYDIGRIHAQEADPEFRQLCERLLAGSIGTATAEHLIRSAAMPEQTAPQNLFGLIDQTGQAIEFNRELLQTTLDHIGQAVSVVDGDLRLVAWNRQYIEFFNFEPDFIKVGKPIEEVIRHNVERGYGPLLNEDMELRIQKRLEYLRNGEAYVFVRDWQNGKTIQTEGARMPDGGYITTYTDITPLKKAEKRLEKINETLEAKVEERTEMLSVVNQQLEEVLNNKTHFLAAASHDLLQPLGASKLYLGALQEDLVDDESKQLLANNALGALKTAESLLRSLLHLSKMDSGLLEPEIKHFSIQELFDSIENEFSVSASQKGLKFRIAPTSVMTTSDKSLLLSILQNLVANAIRYTETGAVIVSCRRYQGRLMLEVRDSGPGIAPEKQQEIFKAFTRLDHKAGDGVGLGLAIGKQAAQLLGHEIRVRSRLGKGSCFQVIIPRYIEKQVSEKVSPVEVNASRSIEGLRVIHVDDDAEILNAGKVLLQRWGMFVISTQSVDDFVTLVKSGERFDVLMMDYQLQQRMNGLELMDYYRQQVGDNFFGIMMTAEQDAQLKQRVVDAGYQFLPKPAEPAKLRSLFQSYILK